MAEPVTVTISHQLGREEALRRIKVGLERARTTFAHLLTIEEEIWSGDQVSFRVRALGQTASGTIDVLEDALRLQVTLPWLLEKIAGRFMPHVRKEATLLLERK